MPESSSKPQLPKSSDTLDEAAKDLLLCEFETSWQQVFSIDNRRGIYFNYFNVAFFGVLTFTASVWSKPGAPSLPAALALTTTFILLVFMSRAVVEILESERDANVRYRKKINLIREMLLAHLTDPKVKYYLEQKQIGIKTFTSERDAIDAVGRTLKGIYFLLHLQQAALVVLVVLIWLGFFLLPKAA